jgi:hypothetical protein
MLVFVPLLALVNMLHGDGGAHRAMPPLALAGVVLAVALSIETIRAGLRHRRRPRARAQSEAAARPLRPAVPAAPEPEPGPSRLAARLGLRAGAEPWHITVDDHDVEVRASDGSRHRALMRFADAVAETGAVAGAVVHRSHWVADLAVLRVERAGGRRVLVLRDGTEVPVSRSCRDAVARFPVAAPQRAPAAVPERVAVRSE